MGGAGVNRNNGLGGGNGLVVIELICPEGYYCPAGASSPVRCPIGHYCPSPESNPVPCPAGSARFGTGFSSLNDCSGKKVFTFTGDVQYLDIEEDGVYEMKLWGAGGGGAGGTSHADVTLRYGGAGGFSSGTVNVTKGERLEVVVGGGGGGGQRPYRILYSTNHGETGAAGYGGGGYGTGHEIWRLGGGGGRSSVRVFSSGGSVPRDIAYAGGGGGGGGCNHKYYSYCGSQVSPHGGSGGGLSGSSSYQGGGGGTQSGVGVAPWYGSGYTHYSHSGWQNTVVPASGHTGGSGAPMYGAGGGGGYYGGGSGRHHNHMLSGGGGGSGYVDGFNDEYYSVHPRTVTGTLTVPPEQSDPDYIAGIGVGGGSSQSSDGTSGGAGLVVVRAVCPEGYYCPAGAAAAVRCPALHSCTATEAIMNPSSTPTSAPSSEPSSEPSGAPSSVPSSAPTSAPSTSAPSSEPSGAPSGIPSAVPTSVPTHPTSQPSGVPSSAPSTCVPTRVPTCVPSLPPSYLPSSTPSSSFPTEVPSNMPLSSPSGSPSASPSSSRPSSSPTTLPPLTGPTSAPTATPTVGDATVVRMALSHLQTVLPRTTAEYPLTFSSAETGDGESVLQSSSCQAWKVFVSQLVRSRTLLVPVAPIVMGGGESIDENDVWMEHCNDEDAVDLFLDSITSPTMGARVDVSCNGTTWAVSKCLFMNYVGWG